MKSGFSYIQTSASSQEMRVAAELSQTVHNWQVIESKPAETRERCDGHCKATCTRSKDTRLLIAFDRYGQLPRTERLLIE